NNELQSRADELSASEERFRLLVDSVRDYAIYMLDSSGRVSTWNEGARRLHGYQNSEIVGQHFSKFFVQVDIEAGKPNLELETARSAGWFQDEGFRIRKDGTTFFSNVILTAIRDKMGLLRGFAKITRDISELKEAQVELAESEERYRQMVDVVRDYGIFRLDR